LRQFETGKIEEFSAILIEEPFGHPSGAEKIIGTTQINSY